MTLSENQIWNNLLLFTCNLSNVNADLRGELSSFNDDKYFTRENFGKTVEAAMNVIMLEMDQVWYNQSILKLKFTKKKTIGFLESNLNQLTTVHKQLVKYKWWS